MNDSNEALKKFLIQLFGYSLAVILLFTLVLSLTLVINSFIVGVILYFLDLLFDSAIFSVGNIIFGASLLTIIGLLIHKNNKKENNFNR